jgi:GAG-pre-integrase domain
LYAKVSPAFVSPASSSNPNLLPIHGPVAPESLITPIIKTSKDNPYVWHARLGHISMTTLALMVKEGMVTGINLCAEDFKACADDKCSSCILGKMARPAYIASGNKATRPLELIHTDIAGPYPTVGINGER